MRITLYATLFLAIFNLSFAHGQEVYGGSSNIEKHRSYILPSSSAQEAKSDKSEAMRYAIPVEGWAQQGGIAATYASSFEPPFSWIGRQSFISIESASAPYTLIVGGRVVGSCMTPSMPAEFNVTRFVKSEEQTSIEISLLSDTKVDELEAWRGAESFNIGNVMMLSQPTMYIRDVEVETTRVAGLLNATVAIVVKSEALNARRSNINYEFLTPQGAYVTRGSEDLNLSMRQEDTIRLFAIIPDSLAWSAENPNLYQINLSTQYRGRHLEYHSFKIGLRSIEVQGRGELIVNGVPQTLKAVEVDSSIDAKELSQLKEGGYNAVKLSAGDHNRDIYNHADSIGVYVIATAPINSSHSGDDIKRGGNPTNDPARLNEYIERVDAIYNSTKLHPSVIAYSIADNSLNGINLYESYLYLKQREASRPIIYLDDSEEWNSDKLDVEL